MSGRHVTALTEGDMSRLRAILRDLVLGLPGVVTDEDTDDDSDVEIVE